MRRHALHVCCGRCEQADAVRITRQREAVDQEKIEIAEVKLRISLSLTEPGPVRSTWQYRSSVPIELRYTAWLNVPAKVSVCPEQVWLASAVPCPVGRPEVGATPVELATTAVSAEGNAYISAAAAIADRMEALMAKRSCCE